MLKVGLTGGVACGKSTVGEMFVARGAQLIKADLLGHELLEPGHEAYEEVIRLFGPGILNPDGTISRRKLAEAAFGNGRIQELNEVIHPLVIARQEEWMKSAGRKDPRAIAIVEAALMLEAGVGKGFDKLVVVTCTPEQKIARFAERQRISTEEAEAEVQRRMAVQWPEEKKVAAADYLIDNSGALAHTEKQVERVYAELRRLVQ